MNNKEIKLAAKTMASAFSTHENMSKIFTTRQSMYYLFVILIRVINRTGDIFIYEEDEPIGFLTFMEPINGKDLTLPKIIRYAWFQSIIFLIVSLKDIRKIKSYLTDFSKKEEIVGRNMHLMQAGINPAYKGKGHMTELFELANHYYKDYDGIVLETSDASNIGLYKHLGYEIIQVIGKLHIFRRELR